VSHDFDIHAHTAQKSKEVVIALKHLDGLPGITSIDDGIGEYWAKGRTYHSIPQRFSQRRDPGCASFR
jgi:hypothetical protein